MALHTIEICAGVGMLGEGLRAGLDHLGIAYRTVCYVEREAYAAGVLVARMEEGSLDAAPVWADVTTFDARRWRGKVDCVVAGFPCQDISVAGRRAGLDGKRSGLFFEVLRIADDCGARFIALENVAGIASATATVMDEEEGELEERAAARVVGELADSGWDAEWLHLSAADVGASHGRERWFCVAWRELADAMHTERRSVGIGSHGGVEGDDGIRREAHGRTGIADAPLANPGSPRRQGSELGIPRAGDRRRTQAHGSTGELCGLFSPGPNDPRWAEILRHRPDLAPALEPDFRQLVDGLAFDMDDSRSARLKCIGNGVVALCAAVAFVELFRRALSGD